MLLQQTPDEAAEGARALMATLFAKIAEEDRRHHEARERELSYRPRSADEDARQRDRLQQLAYEHHLRTKPIREEIDYITRHLVTYEAMTNGRRLSLPGGAPAPPTVGLCGCRPWWRPGVGGWRT